REPHRQISIYTELLYKSLKDRSTPEEQQFFANLMKGAKRMGALIESVYSYSRAEYEVTALVNVSAQETLESCKADLDMLLKATAASIVCQAPLPVVRADRVSLVRIFSTVIPNSNKYRSEAPPDVRISAESDGNSVVFCVEDNGSGIDPNYHSRI